MFARERQQQIYRLVEEPVEVTLEEEYIRQGLQVALDEFERGEFAPWDIEATIAEAKRRFQFHRPYTT